MQSFTFTLPVVKYLILKFKKKKVGEPRLSFLVACPASLITQSVTITLSSADLQGAMLYSRMTANCYG